MDRARVERISKALADKTRLTIFEMISAREDVNCGEIVAIHGVTPATVSHHLKILSEAGLIESCRHGHFVCNRTIPETMEKYTRALSRMARGRKPARKR